MSQYRFGDTATASDRLVVLAAAFEESSRSFLRQFSGAPVEVAVDLGCGPGYTTHLLAQVSAAARTIGLDHSEKFLDLAESDLTPGRTVSFARHDVTTVPFPAPPADLLYGRFLLTHLTGPEQVVERWVTQLRPGGALLLDEVEYVRTRHPVLDRYQEVVLTYLEHYGNRLEVGPLLDGIDLTPRADRLHSAITEVRPHTDQVALMFARNLAVWRHDAFLAGRFGARHLAALQDDLHELVGSGEPLDAVWGIRQIAYRRGPRA